MSDSTPHIVLGVTASIALHRSLDLLSEWRKRGYQVSVIMTPQSQRLIQPVTFQALSHGPVYVDHFEVVQDFEHGHIRLAQDGSVFVVAPATAGTLAKMAHGFADNLLTTTALTFEGPRLMAPAMNHRMWNHPQVQANIGHLEDMGWTTIPPQDGDLACGEEGLGRLAEVSTILAAVDRCLS